MKGLVFREYLDFVEDVFGPDTMEDMIDAADIKSGGAYTVVGLYDWREMTRLVGALSTLTGQDARGLQTAFGEHLLGRMADRYPEFFETCSCTFELLESVNEKIHVEVLKLYPDAELPEIEATPRGASGMRVIYTSCRPFGDLCVGMIQGAAAFFGETVEIAATPHQRGLTITLRLAAGKAA